MSHFITDLEGILSLEATCKKICRRELPGNLNPHIVDSKYYYRIYDGGSYHTIYPSNSDFSKYIDKYCAVKLLRLIGGMLLVPGQLDECLHKIDVLCSHLFTVFNERTPKWALPRKIIIQRWQDEEYAINDYFPENKIFRTDRGENVRSKSETIAANSLNKLGIPYRYEAPVRTQYGTRYPDFTILNLKTGNEEYLELFGLMGELDYASNAAQKMHEYSKSGIILGTNLLIIFETSLVPFSIEEFETMMRSRYL